MSYEIRHMTHRDAAAVSDLFRLIYGDTYDIPDVYSPEREEELDATGRVLSFVAVDDSDTVVGHYGITVDAYSRIGEGGEAVVHPDHRGHHLLEKMRTFAESAVIERGMGGLFFEPVTVHTFSQRANESDQAKVCGFNLGVSPRGTTYRGIEADTSSQRVSMVVYFKPLGEIPSRKIAVPACDRELSLVILDHLSLPYVEHPLAPPAGLGRHIATVDLAHGFAAARALECGSDTLPWIFAQKTSFIDGQHGETFFVDLPLTGADVSSIAQALRANGFRCIGLVPELGPDGPIVRYAFLTETYDPERIAVLSPFARKLLTQILS